MRAKGLVFVAALVVAAFSSAALGAEDWVDATIKPLKQRAGPRFHPLGRRPASEELASRLRESGVHAGASPVAFGKVEEVDHLPELDDADDDDGGDGSAPAASSRGEGTETYRFVSRAHASKRRGFIKSAWEGIKKIGRHALQGFKEGLFGKPRPPMPPPPPVPVPPPIQPPPNITLPPPEMRPEDIEDCVACKYVWGLVELQVGNDAVEENIYDAFVQSCLEAQKAPIFYPACEDMFDDVYGMIGDYMDGYTVNQICDTSRLCRV